MKQEDEGGEDVIVRVNLDARLSVAFVPVLIYHHVFFNVETVSRAKWN